MVRSPLTAVSAAFALKAGEWFRRGRLLMVSPVHGDYRRCQAEIPLIVLFRFPGPALIFAQGEEADKIFYIQSGKVKITVVSEQGKEAVVGILDKAQFFGEGCLNGQAVRVGTARAMEDCLITSITRKAMLATAPQGAKVFRTFRDLLSNQERARTPASSPV